MKRTTSGTLIAKAQSITQEAVASLNNAVVHLAALDDAICEANLEERNQQLNQLNDLGKRRRMNRFSLSTQDRVAEHEHQLGERERQLGEREREHQLDERERQLGERERQLGERERQLGERERQLDERVEEHKQKFDEWERQFDFERLWAHRLDQREKLLADGEQALLQREQGFQRASTQLRAREEAITCGDDDGTLSPILVRARPVAAPADDAETEDTQETQEQFSSPGY